jgi:hypothetical protein
MTRTGGESEPATRAEVYKFVYVSVGCYPFDLISELMI